MVLACKGLGLEQEMLGPLCKAAAHGPKDRVILKELDITEKRLQSGDLVVDL